MYSKIFRVRQTNLLIVYQIPGFLVMFYFVYEQSPPTASQLCGLDSRLTIIMLAGVTGACGY